MSSSAALVSVVMPVFNTGKYLRRPVEAILSQTWPSLELIAVNDGSSDGSLATLQEFAARDPRVKVIDLPVNQGAPSARNAGLEQARGEYVAMQSHDDIAHPTRLERQVQFLQDHPAMGAVCSAVDYLDGEEKPMGSPELPPPTDFEIRLRSLFENPFHISSLMFRRMLLDDPTLRYETRVPQRSEYAFHLRLLERTQIGSIPDILVTYVMHGNNLSIRSREKMQTQEDLLAWEAVTRALPEFNVTLEQVIAIRTSVRAAPRGVKRTLQSTREAWGLHGDLLAAFRKKQEGTGSYRG